MVDRYANAGKAWTAEQEKSLRELFESNQSLKAMCDKLEPTSAGIIARLLKLNLIDQASAYYLGNHNWSSIPSQISRSRIVQIAVPSSGARGVLQVPILYNEIAADRVGFSNFLSWVEQIGDSGCKKGVSGDIGRFYDYDRYLSVGDVLYQLRQLSDGVYCDPKAHRFVFLFGDSSVNAKDFLTLLWKQCWKEKLLKPFHWYGIQHHYPGNFHIHALVEGRDWEFQQIRFRAGDLRSIERIAQSVLSHM